MVVYVVSKPQITNLSRGVYTNRLKLFKDLKKYGDSLGMVMKFDGIIGYNSKKLNYENLRMLLKSINKNESFGVLMEKGNTKTMCEICKMDTNKLLM